MIKTIMLILEMQIYVMDIIVVEGAKNGRINKLAGNLVRYLRERKGRPNMDNATFEDELIYGYCDCKVRCRRNCIVIAMDSKNIILI